MSATRDAVMVFALGLAAALTAAWDGLLGYGLFLLVRGAF
jgi:hypothetical protein